MNNMTHVQLDDVSHDISVCTRRVLTVSLSKSNRPCQVPRMADICTACTEALNPPAFVSGVASFASKNFLVNECVA